MANPESWERARQEVLDYCRRLQAEHLGYSTAGNISCRVAEEPNLFAVTPTNFPYDALELDDICVATTGGEVVDGRRKPTSEFPMHTLIYARRPEVGAVIHTHSPAAMVMAVMGWTLPPTHRVRRGIRRRRGHGSVLTTGDRRDGRSHGRGMRDRSVCFLRHHGLLAIGADLSHAFFTASVTEGAALVYLRARQFGVEVPVLPESEVAWSATTGSLSGLIESRQGRWSERRGSGEGVLTP